MKKTISYFIALSMLISTLSACADETETPGVTAYAGFEAEYTDRDCDSTYANAKEPDLSGGSVTISEEGVYIISGTLNGSITVDAPDTDKIQLVLRNASLASTDGPALYVKQCDKLFLTLEGENTVTDSGTYTLPDGENEPDAAIFSENDITINGSGSLSATGNYKHGIASKDDIKLIGGTVTVNSVEDGIKGKDSVLIKDGNVNITAGTDGIQSSNSNGEEKGRISIDGGNVSIVCGNDGIQAESVLQINGGTINITAGDEPNTEIKVSMLGGGMRPGMNMPGEMMVPEGVPPVMPENMNGKMMPGGGRGGMRHDMNGAGGMTVPEGTPPAMDGNMMPGGGRGGMRPDMNGAGGMTVPDGIPPAMDGNMNSADSENSESIKGLKSANALYINGGTITVSAEDDAIHSDIAAEINGGTLNLRSADDAIHAEYNTTINDGNITIARSYEGIEGKAVVINGGNIDVSAEDDGINASDPESTNSMPGRGDDSIYVEINGGEVKVVSGVDGIDSNGNIIINGGNVVVDGPSNGMECAIDCDGNAYVNGGEIVANGVSALTTFSEESEQASISVIFSAMQSAGATVTLTDSDGNIISTLTPTRSFGGVVFSSKKLKKGKTYTVKTGSISVNVELDSLRTIVSDTGEAVSGGMGKGMMPDGGRGGNRGGRVSFNDAKESLQSLKDIFAEMMA